MSKEKIVEWLKKHKKGLIITSTALIIMITIIVSIWSAGYNASKNKYIKEIDRLESKISQLENTPVVLEPVTPEIVQKVLNEKKAKASKLITAEYLFTNAAKFTDTKHIAVLPDSWTEKSFIQQWDGVIYAGIDLEKSDVSVKNNTIIITIPYAEIISYEIDKENVRILDEKNNVFNPISVNDKVNFDRETSYDMEARAVKHGLLTTAQENAESILTELLIKSIDNIKEYEIKFNYVD